MTLTFPEARASVLREAGGRRTVPEHEQVALHEAGGRVLAATITADRDFPALDRSVRDGFAIRAEDLPGPMKIVGEVRAGATFAGRLQPGEAVEIMTGAPLPAGADAVIMIEHVTRRDGLLWHKEEKNADAFISRRGEEARAGQVLIAAGKRLRFTDVAMLAATGHAIVPVYRKPRVAVLATGDELVDVSVNPDPHQVRNSNVYALARQVERAGGLPEILPVARDQEGHTRELIERGLAADLLLLSGGVSAGRYDVVEPVLTGLGAEFFFDRVKIQPGQPLVFGRARGKFFFGLPGNPGSTMLTFELFASAAIELLGGQHESALPLALGRLTEPFHQKPGLTRFLPARLSGPGDLTPIPWHGSGDMPAISHANAFLVTDPDRAEWQTGDIMPVLRVEG